MIEDKIMEYLMLEFEDEVSIGRVKDIAKDIAEICEAEYDKKFFAFVEVTDRYEAENKSLKDKLDTDRIVGILDKIYGKLLMVQTSIPVEKIVDIQFRIVKEIIGE